MRVDRRVCPLHLVWPVVFLMMALFCLPTLGFSFQLLSVQGDYAFDLSGEYRMRVFNIDPIKLNGPDAYSLGYGSMRLRTNMAATYKGILAVKTQLNILDGVVLGDNGVWGTLLSPKRGSHCFPKRGLKHRRSYPTTGALESASHTPMETRCSPTATAPFSSKRSRFRLTVSGAK